MVVFVIFLFLWSTSTGAADILSCVDAGSCLECNSAHSISEGDCVWCESTDTCIAEFERGNCEYSKYFLESCEFSLLANCMNYHDCSDCTRDLNCVWLDSGNVDAYDFEGDHTTSVTVKEFNQSCFYSVPLVQYAFPGEFHRVNHTYYISTYSAYWAQCYVTNIQMYVILIVILAFVLCLFAVCCGCNFLLCCKCCCSQPKVDTSEAYVSLNGEKANNYGQM